MPPLAGWARRWTGTGAGPWPGVGSARGSILLYVVWTIMLLSLFAVSIGSQAIASLNATERLWRDLRANALARSALQYALLVLERDESATVDSLSEAWADSPGIFNEHELAGGTFHLFSQEPSGEKRDGLTDEERHLSLNTTPADILERLFERVGGLPPDEAHQAAVSVEDWRDADSNPHDGGAEGFYYRARSAPYDCKDGPFENVEELLLIRGMTPAAYQRVAPYVTVYGSGFLNLNTASPQVLDALGLSEAGVNGLLAFRAGEDGQAGTGDERRLVSTETLESELGSFVPKADLALLTRLSGKKLFGVGASDFWCTVQARARRSTGPFVVECVFTRSGEMKLWHER